MDPIETMMMMRWREFSRDVEKLLTSERRPISDSKPPNAHGIYIFYDEQGECCYVGQAQGSYGLEDRIMRKHVCGADTHALQRAFMARFPDRNQRREFIKKRIQVQWLVVEGQQRIQDLERLLIWLLQPRLNLG